MRIVAIVLALAATVVGVALFARAVARIVDVVRLGRPVAGRRDSPGPRGRTRGGGPRGRPRLRPWDPTGPAG